MHLRSVELVQEGINGRLVLDIDLLLNQGRCDDVVDVGHGLGDALAAPLGFVSITKLASFVGAGGSARRYDGTVKTGFADEVDLDGWVTARVVDGTGVNPGDGHVGCLSICLSGSKLDWVCVKVRSQLEQKLAGSESGKRVKEIQDGRRG